jgi:hypothetical protein
MTEEFYHKNIFGEVVDINLADLPAGGEDDDQIKAKRSDFNIFSLTDAIGARDKKNAWVLYQKALAGGMAPDEIFWKVVWAIKTMLIAKCTNSAEEAEMKPFPYSKAKSNLKNFKDGELEQISENLVVGYHNARRGIGEIDSLIEKILLGL